MPLTTTIKARTVSREMLAWREPRSKHAPRSVSDIGGSTFLTGLQTFIIGSAQYASHEVSFESALPEPIDTVSLAPFRLVVVASRRIQVSIVAVCTSGPTKGLLLALRRNGEDVGYADASLSGSESTLDLKFGLDVFEDDELTIELRGHNPTSGPVVVSVESISASISNA